MALDFSLIKEHPLATGAIVLGGGIGLYLYYHAAGAASSPAQGTTIIQGPSDQLQAVSIQSGTAIQQAQSAVKANADTINGQIALASIAAGAQRDELAVSSHAVDQNVSAANHSVDVAAQVANFAVSGQVQTSGAGLSEKLAEAQLSAGTAGADIAKQITLARIASDTSVVNTANAITGATNIATIQAGTDQLAISSQATVQLAGTQAALDAAKSHDAADVSKTLITTSGAVDVAGLEAATAQADTAAKLAAFNSLQVTNQTAINADAANTHDLIAYAGDRAADSKNLSDQVLQLLGTGKVNKGGEGGANQVSVIGAVLGYPSIGGPAQSTAASDASSSSKLWSTVIGAGTSIITGLFGGPAVAAAGAAKTATSPVTPAPADPGVVYV